MRWSVLTVPAVLSAEMAGMRPHGRTPKRRSRDDTRVNQWAGLQGRSEGCRGRAPVRDISTLVGDEVLERGREYFTQRSRACGHLPERPRYGLARASTQRSVRGRVGI